MKSKRILLSAFVFLAAAGSSIVFDSSRAQSIVSGSGVSAADTETSEGAKPDPCGNKKCDLTIDNDVEYTSIEGSGDRDAINVLKGATLSISEGG